MTTKVPNSMLATPGGGASVQRIAATTAIPLDTAGEGKVMPLVAGQTIAINSPTTLTIAAGAIEGGTCDASYSITSTLTLPTTYPGMPANRGVVVNGSITAGFNYRVLFGISAGDLVIFCFQQSAVVTAPGQVTGLTLGTATSTTQPLTWTAPASNGGSAITDYLVEYKLSASGTWLTFVDGVGTAASATVTGLTASSAYDYRVSAINAIGTGVASGTASGSTAAADVTAPTLVSATVSNSTPSQIDLVWSEAMNATVSAPAAFTVSAGHALTAHTYVTATTSYLTTSTAFVNGEAARTLAYTQPGTNNMQDLAGNLLANIASAAITNNVAAAGGTIAQRGAATTQGNNTFINLPTGSVVGDRVHLAACGGGVPATVSGMVSVLNGVDSLSVPYRVFAKTLVSGDITAGTLTIPTGSVSWILWGEYGGSASEESPQGANYSNTATTAAVPASTSTVNNSWHIALYGDDQNGSNTVATAPAGYTLIALFANGSGATNTTAVYRKTITSAGTTGTPQLVWGTAGAYGYAAGFISKA